MGDQPVTTPDGHLPPGAAQTFPATEVEKREQGPPGAARGERKEPGVCHGSKALASDVLTIQKRQDLGSASHVNNAFHFLSNFMRQKNKKFIPDFKLGHSYIIFIVL